MSSSFNVHDASAYEQLMGRWSKRLAPLLIDFAGLAEGEKILDVGCGNGSLAFALAKTAGLTEIAAIDYSPVFVAEAIRRNSDPRIHIRQADACDLPFADGTFDRALALLVLHFVPEAGKAVAQMRRVWAGDPPFDGADPVGPPPVQPGGPSLVAGVLGPKALALAAQ